VVVYSEPLTRKLSEEMEEAYRRFPYRSEAVGGVLFGTREGLELRVTAARVVPYPLMHGSGIEFTGAAEEEFRQVIRSAATDPELKDLVVVGWYRSRSRSGIVPGLEDAKLFNRFFPLQWQVELILDPVQGQSARGGFFFRSASGSRKAEWNLLESEAGKSEPEDWLPPVETVRQPEMKRKFGRGELALWGGLAVAAAIGVSVAGFQVGRSANTSTDGHRLALQLVKDGGQLLATWNASSPAVEQATRGTLLVNDGGIVSNFELGQAPLRTGAWPIVHRSQEVLVRLKVDMIGVGEVAELARYEEPEQASPNPGSSPVPVTDRTRLQDERRVLTHVEPRAVANATTTPRSEQKRVETPSEGAPQEATLGVEPTGAAQAVPPAPVPPAITESSRVALISPSPPPVSPRGDAPIVKTEPVLPQKAGRLIWTGYLAAGARLSIIGNRVSMGTVSGSLPSALLRVTVYPGELSSHGLTVYSAQDRHAARNVVEPRSARSGWLETQYIYDVNRAGTVSVVEVPTGANGYELTLQGGERPSSVVVIDWQVAP
jgi:hypothetical protein